MLEFKELFVTQCPLPPAGSIAEAARRRSGSKTRHLRAAGPPPRRNFTLEILHMTINKSGKWWIGDQPTDIREYLVSYSEENYKINEFRLARCGCSSDEFILEADDEQGFAKRTCIRCSHIHYICDSEENLDDASPESISCIECGNKTANIGVGFSFTENNSAIKWLYVSCRCAQCGVLGCFAGWRVGYEPSLQLIELA